MNPDTIKAVLFGIAAGDTLGYQVEFMRMDEIRRRFGPEGVRDFPPGALWSDDSQMTHALAEGLLDAHGGLARRELIDPNFVMPFVTERFVEWAKSPENNRAPGGTCMAGCRNLAKGMSWRESGITRSKGCGGMMRAAPVGLLYSTREDVLRIAKAQCICTHGSPSAYQSAQLTALAVHLLGRRLVEPGELLDVLRTTLAVLPNPDPKLTDLLWRVRGALDLVLEDEDTPEGIQQRVEDGPKNLGESWHGDEAVASALFCFLLAAERGEGYVETVRYGANTVGDSDSIAAVSGAFSGAWWGLDTAPKGVPESWVDWVEDSGYLLSLADRIHKASL